MPRILSIFGSLVTSDNYLVFGLRSHIVSEGSKISAPGGIVQWTTQPTSTYIFQEFKREVSEEIGIHPDDIHDARIIGLAIRPGTFQTPKIVFAGRTHLTKDEIDTQFHHSDREFDKPIFIPHQSNWLDVFHSQPLHWSVPVLYQCMSDVVS